MTSHLTGVKTDAKTGAAPGCPKQPVLLCGDFDTTEQAAWQAALTAALPEVQWLSPAQARSLSGAHDSALQVAVVANPPAGSLSGWPGLRLVQSLWAGVDRLLQREDLPPQAQVARMVDPAMTAAMVQTALWAVLALHRGFFRYARQQQQAQWRVQAQQRAAETPVLVLGQGELGRAVAAALAALGYPVQSWRRDGQTLAAALAGLRRQQPAIVINLLPLTPATTGLLDTQFFEALPRGSSLVNLARGAHVVDADLLAALASGQLRHAVLDVFQTEPLPPDHAFWLHPQLTVLPHAAALTDHRSAASVVAHNLRSFWAGRPLLHRVDRQRGY